MDQNYAIPDYHCNPGFAGGNFWQEPLMALPGRFIGMVY